MATGNKALLDETKLSMMNCDKLLNEISKTCCMPERSPNMEEAFDKIENTLKHIELAYQDDKSISKAIEDIGSFGSMIGYLFATCCTETREPLYQNMYKEMNSAHGKLWQYMGHSH